MKKPYKNLDYAVVTSFDKEGRICVDAMIMEGLEPHEIERVPNPPFKFSTINLETHREAKEKAAEMAEVRIRQLYVESACG